MISVRVIYHCDPGGSWWADSPVISGWSATADSVDELRKLAEEGVRFALERDDVCVEHELEGANGSDWLTFDFVLGQTTGRMTVGAHAVSRA